MTEAEICSEFVTPKLTHAGWGAAESLIGDDRTFNNGRIIVAGDKVRRGKQHHTDYLSHYRSDIPVAVFKAKKAGIPDETGLRQTRKYAKPLRVWDAADLGEELLGVYEKIDVDPGVPIPLKRVRTLAAHEEV